MKYKVYFFINFIVAKLFFKNQFLSIIIQSLKYEKSKLELAKKNVLTLAIAQGLSITSTGINIIHTGLVGVMLAPKAEYATIPLSFQFITVALTLIPISLLMGKFGRKIIFFSRNSVLFYRFIISCFCYF